MKIVDFSTRRPVTVTMVFLAVTVFGWVSYDKLALDLLPEISYPTLTVRTNFEGAAPAEVENLISKPIENRVGVVNNVIQVSSISRPDVSDVVLEFSWQTDMDFAALDVREKLDLITLPDGAEQPILLRYDPSTDPIMRLSASSSSDLATVRYLSEEFIKADLESLGGVAAVRVSGGFEEEIYVELDEQRLTALGLSIEDIGNRLAQENINLTGGTLQEGERKYLLRTLNEFESVEEISEVIVGLRNRAPLRVRDIGRVYTGVKERTIITRINGQESVEIAVFKMADSNTVSVAGAVRARLQGLEEEYRGTDTPLRFEVVLDQSRFIRQSIEQVLDNALWGGVLAIVVIFLFLRNLRSTVIIGLSIPISIVATFFLMYAFGISLNIMSLSGLALGIGMLVDNSIVVLESIFRYRRRGYSNRQAAGRGASEVGRPVIASTLTTVCVFFPIVFVEGVSGQLFSDQALTVTFALSASLVVAIMLIPMLASLGAEADRKATAEDDRKEEAFWLAMPYLWVLRGALRHRLLSVMSALALLAGSFHLWTALGAELIPEISQGEFLVDLELPPGAPLEETSSRLELAEQVAARHPGIQQYYTMVGAGSKSGVFAVEEREHIGQILVRLKPGLLHEREGAVMDELRAGLQGLPGLDYSFSRPTLFSFKTPVEVVLRGYNLPGLKANAERLQARLEEIPGLTDLRASTEGGNPEVQIRFDRRRLAGFGLSVSQAASVVRHKVLGGIPTEFREGDRKTDIRVVVSEEDRHSLQDLRNLVVGDSGEGPIYLSSVAEIVIEEGPTEIRRIGPDRVAIITGTAVGKDLQSMGEDIEQVLAQFPLPEDFTVFVAGQSQEQKVAFESMGFAIGLAIFLVYLVMASQFESLVQPLVIIFSIPFAGMGVALALYLTGQIINVVVLIGVVVLAGIVVNNSIVLIDFANQVRRQGLEKFEAVRRACAVRFRPILMTTSTTVLGLAPMALNWGQGAELRVPLAVTIIGGLSTSMLLTLVLVPVLYTLVVGEEKA